MKYFVIIKENKIVGRQGGYSAGETTHYGYKVRGWAEKFATKSGGDVYSVQGQDFNNLQSESDHIDLANAAAREFCA